ncbi:hypothetical protein ACO0QE_002824 [Hanseniaspora vineae]
MSKRLSKEYFDLVKDALAEERGSRTTRQSKRKKPNEATPKIDEIVDLDSDSDADLAHGNSQDVITLDSSEDNPPSSEDNFDDEEFNSDDFEDVPMDEHVSSGDEQDDNMTFTINTTKQTSGTPKKREVNSVSKEEKRRRLFFHKTYLLTLLVHGYLRNKILNDPKLHKKLDKLIPDQVFDLLHPPKDNELPLRSTRKLLDGLKKSIEIWQKYYTCSYDNNHYLMGLYMRPWNEIGHSSSKKRALLMSQEEFLTTVLKKKSGSREIGTQGFVALLRAVGLNARLVFSLQPPDLTVMKKELDNKDDFDLQLLLKQTNVFIADKKLRKMRINTDAKYEVQTKPENDIAILPVESLKYPLFWCEVWNKFNKTWITVDPMNFKTIEQHTMNQNSRSKLEPLSHRQANKFNLLRYVIGYDRKLGCKDITPRYTTQFHSKVYKKRCTRDDEAKEWYENSIKFLNLRGGRGTLKIDEYEDEFFTNKLNLETIPDSLQDFSGHPKFILENQIPSDSVLRDGAKHCGFFRIKNRNKSLKVYLKSDILKLKTARQWYMEGRVLKAGAQHLKIVKKRKFGPTKNYGDSDDDDMERLYSVDSTELFVPPLASPRGEIQTNVYGNIDVYQPNMIPMNCVLIEDALAIRAAKFIRVPFAKAVTGFEFEKGFTVKPKISGVVCLRDFKDAVCSAIEGIKVAEEEEKEENREVAALSHWVTLLKKLKIQQRLNMLHGSVDADNQNVQEVAAGGFVAADRNDDQDFDQEKEAGFLHEDEQEGEEGGGFVVNEEVYKNDAGEASDNAGGFVQDILVEKKEDSTHPEDEGGFLPDSANSVGDEKTEDKQGDEVNLSDEYNAFLEELNSD